MSRQGCLQGPLTPTATSDWKRNQAPLDGHAKAQVPMHKFPCELKAEPQSPLQIEELRRLATDRSNKIVPDAQGEGLGRLYAQKLGPAAVGALCCRARPNDGLIKHQAAAHIPQDAMHNFQRRLPRLFLGCTTLSCGFWLRVCFSLHPRQAAA